MNITAISMPNINMMSPESKRSSQLFATPEKCYKARSNRINVRLSAKNAHRAKPLGATMVSSEGVCAAYYNYGRFAATAK